VAVRQPGNAAGAEAVLSWLTGAPAAVTFARGEPRYEPGAATGELARDADALLLVGIGEGDGVPPPALQRVVPTVWIGPSASGSKAAAVAIAAAPIESTAGTIFRMDGAVLRPRPGAQDPEGRPTEAEVLSRIRTAVDELAARASA
jgi:formylmethanofuran dehydrogenase subunit B